VRAGVVELPARTSSQFASSLMLALAQVEGESEVRLAAPVASRPYLAVTAEVAEAFGLRFGFVDEPDGGLSIRVPGGQRPAASRYAVEGDWSGAAFMLVAAALLERSVALVGLRREAVQGDRVVAELVGRFGARVGWRGAALVLEPGPLRGAGAIDVGATPDLFPPLCALAAGSVGSTVLYGAPGLRDKECDRIAAMAEGLGRLGVRCRERRDGIEIGGGSDRGGGGACL
jgi:3-phosphoshikimate 1-carboxyvinyltransferase